MRTKRDIVTEYLVLEAQAGGTRGERAFGQIVRLWDRPLRAFIWRQVGSQRQSDDLQQEIWLAITRGLARLDDPARFAPWAYRIARNKCIDAIRRSERHRKLFSDVSEQNADPVAAHEDAPSDPAGQVRALLEQLPDDQRQLLTMHYLDEFSVRDMALVLGIPEGTVKSRLFHARRFIKQHVENQHIEDTP